MNNLEKIKIEAAIKSLAKSPDWYFIRQCYLGEASENKKFDELTSFMLGEFRKLLDSERIMAKERYGLI